MCKSLFLLCTQPAAPFTVTQPLRSLVCTCIRDFRVSLTDNLHQLHMHTGESSCIALLLVCSDVAGFRCS